MSNTTVQPGDVGFSRDLVGFPAPEWWIRFAEARKYGKDKGLFSPAHWNHTWMVTDTDGTIVQATPQGMTKGNARWYFDNPKQQVVLARPEYIDDEASRAVKAMEAMLGDKYAYGSIFTDALSLLFNSTLRVGFTKHHTCSGSVAHALVSSGVVDMDFEEWASPADVFSKLKTCVMVPH